MEQCCEKFGSPPDGRSICCSGFLRDQQRKTLPVTALRWQQAWLLLLHMQLAWIFSQFCAVRNWALHLVAPFAALWAHEKMQESLRWQQIAWLCRSAVRDLLPSWLLHLLHWLYERTMEGQATSDSSEMIISLTLPTTVFHIAGADILTILWFRNLWCDQAKWIRTRKYWFVIQSSKRKEKIPLFQGWWCFWFFFKNIKNQIYLI